MTGSSDSPSSVNEYSTRTGFFADDLAVHEPLLLEVVQRVREDLARDAVDLLLERVEPERSVLEQSMDDDGVPLLPISVAVEVIGHQSSPEHQTSTPRVDSSIVGSEGPPHHIVTSCNLLTFSYP